MRVFFFKQKTAYELRISDWSSDVCSSDLTFGSLEEWRQDCGCFQLDIVLLEVRQAEVESQGARRRHYAVHFHTLRSRRARVDAECGIRGGIGAIDTRQAGRCGDTGRLKLNVSEFGSKGGDIQPPIPAARTPLQL